MQMYEIILHLPVSEAQSNRSPPGYTIWITRLQAQYAYLCIYSKLSTPVPVSTPALVDSQFTWIHSP